MTFKTILSLLFLLPHIAFGAKADAKDIMLGAVFPMTGPIATYGQESVNGMKLALKRINLKGIRGKKVQLIVEDNKGEPVESANAVRKLISVDDVYAILGSVASSNTLAGAPIAQSAKVPMLTPASTNEEVTKMGKYLSRTCFTDAFQGEVMAKFAYNSLNKKHAAIIVDLSSDYSKGLARIFKKRFKAMGGTIIPQDFSYNQKDTDFRTLLRKVKRKKPDIIFLPGYYQEVGLILKQARQIGMVMPFIGGDGWHSDSLLKLAGKKGIKNNYYSSHFSPDDTDPAVQNFVKEYVAAYGSKPGAMAALGYDGLMVMADALKRATSLNREALQKAIASTQNFKGVTGMITLDKMRNARKGAVVLETTEQGNIFKEKISP
ncbi:MAG: ethanolamine utilization protein EutJ [Epsilonproteobacteria bacterium]|nr:MAG: ethanolamine utilization protein EutJ [Campylobacterota bacterium]RLA64388.1 MAG: ethanolamine utilization protein EutJ [Campylobacterota bacterium]